MDPQQQIGQQELHNKDNYQITSLEDEIRADRHCAALLRAFHHFLLEELRRDPLEAGALAAGADYFLREFVIGSRRENIFAIPPERVGQFGGNWYIVRNLEPNLEELSDMLNGTEAFYRYCARLQLIPRELATAIAAECCRFDHYRRRIEEFHQISGDGYAAWERQCPLK